MRQRFGWFTVAFGVLSVSISPAGAQEVDPPPTERPPEGTAVQRFFDWTELEFPAEEYRGRRDRLFDALEGREGAVLIPSGHGLSHGETFRQANDFLYFTGLELPGSVLILDIPSRRATIFVPEQDFRFHDQARPNDFPGRPLLGDTLLASVSGIDDFRAYDQLDVVLRAWARNGIPVHYNPGRDGPIRRVVTTLIPDWDPALLTLFHLQNTYPLLELVNVYEVIAYTRMVKSPREVEAIRRSIDATTASILAAASRIRPGVTERELEAAFESSCKLNGAQRLAFASIIKSGPNSLWPWRILAAHYDRRNRAMEDGDLVIFDVGCEVDYYVSDVGRTFPVAGSFSAEQRRILELEVAVADAIISQIRPGMTFRELQTIGVSVIPFEHREYMQAGLFFGHHIGLSTGDPAIPGQTLLPGMVFTVEPWYYNHDTGISVFTEDVVLVTSDGAEVLSAALPRSPAELEAMVP
ncbi:MAG: Xaa-Pro peptidase family protein [Gemmatimonadota bacterium]|nr:Xaa-Pro peptidase family protein [Gemmatimonadota bacterium]